MTLKTNVIPDRSGPGSTKAALPSGPSREGSEKFATGDKWRNECRATREERNLKRNVGKEEMMIGTWNVRSLRQCGKMEVLVQEMDQMNWNVLGISEMRWKGIDEGTTEDRHKIWYSGNEKKSVHGV